jgi:hypothetical protein
MRPMPIDEIGGGKANTKLSIGGAVRYRGEEITLDELRAMPASNRNCLIENRMIQVYPKQVTFTRSVGHAPIPASQAPAADDLARMVIPRGFGKYDVIEGRVLAVGLTRDDAHRIAGTPVIPKSAEAERAPAAASPPKKKSKFKRGKQRYADKAPPPMPADVGPAAPRRQGDDDGANGPVE